MRSIFIISLLCLCGLISTQGQIHVSPSGNDTNPGTAALPFKTIQKAVTTAHAGDTVFAHEGIYGEKVTVPNSGNETGGYITIRNFPGEHPVLDGSALSVPSNDNGMIYIQDKNYIIIKGFEIRNYRTTVKNYTAVGIRVNGASKHIRILNNHIHHIEHNGTSNTGTNAHGICVRGTSGTDPASDIIIDGNELDSLKLGSSESCVVTGNVHNFRISNNVIHHNNNIGIDAIGYWGVAPANDRAIGGVICDNLVYNIDSYGNVAYGTTKAASGIYVDGGKNIIVERNITRYCNIGIQVASEVTGGSADSIIVRNNFIYGNEVTGLAMGGYDGNRGRTQNCLFINNTFFNNNTYGSAAYGEMLLQNDIRNNRIVNNIFYAYTKKYLFTNYWSNDSGNVIDYNIYFTPFGAGASSWEWRRQWYWNWTMYRNATGLDSHSVFIDPKIKSINLPDLHLVAGSPAINAGITIPFMGDFDIDGELRANGIPDIGADEFYPSTAAREQRPINRQSFSLNQNYPNPFNPSTAISFELTETTNISLTVFNQLGEKIAVLVDDVLGAGRHTVEWNASRFPSGIYFYELKTQDFRSVKKLVLMK